MTLTRRSARRTRSTWSAVVLVLLGVVGALLAPTTVAIAADNTYVPINGGGSSWSSNAIDQWRRNVEQYGMRVNYSSTGSSDGRNQFKAGTVDFASTEIPYGLTDGGVVDTLPSRSFAYMPIVAGGTAFMYNLSVGGKQVTNLRLSGEVLTKIFTGVITKWDDAAITADNPGLTLPRRTIVPVVRSDGSGSTAQLTTWMSSQHQSLWDTYCAAAGRSTPCGITSNFPTVAGKGFVSQPNSQGVAGYVAQAANIGTITYVEYSYALKTGYPVAKILNAAGYYVEPTASNVAVGLLSATINTDKSSSSYLTQNLTGVYTSKDPRTYPLSSYSYVVVPTGTQNGFTTAKGRTLGAFASYFLCEGQQQAEVLGYSPLPINLVQAGLDQVKQIPGVEAKTVDITSCNNPTFSKDGTNTLAKNAPQPSPCDKLGITQCTEGTGGAADKPTAPGGKGTGGSSATPGGAGTGGAGTGGTGAPSGGTGTSTGTPGTKNPGGGAGGTVSTDGTVTTPDGATNGGSTSVVPANFGGGPVVCESDTGVCTSVVAEPVDATQHAGGAGNLLGVGLAVVALIALITLPPLLSGLLPGGRAATSPGAAAGRGSRRSRRTQPGKAS